MGRSCGHGRAEADDGLALPLAVLADDPRGDQAHSRRQDLGQCVRADAASCSSTAQTLVFDEAGIWPSSACSESIPDYLGLVGDSSTGFRGCRLGAKSAAVVLNRYRHSNRCPPTAGSGTSRSPSTGLATTLQDHGKRRCSFATSPAAHRSVAGARAGRVAMARPDRGVRRLLPAHRRREPAGRAAKLAPSRRRGRWGFGQQLVVAAAADGDEPSEAGAASPTGRPVRHRPPSRSSCTRWTRATWTRRWPSGTDSPANNPPIATP